MMMAILWGVWLLVNLFVFALYGADKQRAKKGAWRIPEKTLLTGTWLLGGVGAFAAMRMFRHKTKHLAFQLSAPLGALLSISVMIAASVHLLQA
jgi:uncharacterized membrane protein YsdA (DUF1294 family)